MQPLTQQELGLHLIARYLLTPDYQLPNVEHMIDKLRGAYGLGRIANLSSTDDTVFIYYPVTVCTNCKSCTNLGGGVIVTSGCNLCMASGDKFTFHLYTKCQQLNSDIAFIPYEYKLKLAEILWQTYLRKLL